MNRSKNAGFNSIFRSSTSSSSPSGAELGILPSPTEIFPNVTSSVWKASEIFNWWMGSRVQKRHETHQKKKRYKKPSVWITNLNMKYWLIITHYCVRFTTFYSYSSLLFRYRIDIARKINSKSWYYASVSRSILTENHFGLFANLE